MNPDLLKTILGAAAAVAICAGGVIYVWRHPSRRKFDPDEDVTIAEFSNPEEARMWKMRLESQGVPCVLSGETRTTAAAMMPAAGDLCSIHLIVLGRDVGRARRVLGG